ncbi:MAG: hypothetical protein WBB60_15625 [Nitrospira sp.]|jgi:hypothetical protein|nr:hypothetical protein [Nitrospira sp.]HQY59268.1 hypothetical protein [Nitrospira sp.]HRA95384.1 hypothetical protein [Nitrospira sp.]
MLKQIGQFIGLFGQCPGYRQISLRSVLTGAGILTCLSMGMGCTTQTQIASGHPAMNVDHARDLAFRYREEALVLSKLADGLELEANSVSTQSQHLGSVTAADPRIHNLRKQAEAAFERAREYRAEVPHNQVY